jgi:hypothetical protein
VIQLDEFQLPAGRDGGNELRVFPASAWPDGLWTAVIPRLQQRVRTSSGVIAAPYYENIGLLAYRDGIGRNCLESWEELSLECGRWEKDAPSRNDLFFDFPAVTGENYNSLFFEILLWVQGVNQNSSGAKHCRFRDWLTSNDAVDALILMRRLCRRAYAIRQNVASFPATPPLPT